MKYYYQGNVKEAIKYLKIAIEMEPNNERLQNNLKLMNIKNTLKGLLEEQDIETIKSKLKKII